MTWEYFILGVIAAQIGKMVYLIWRKELHNHRERQLLHVVRVKFPDNRTITFTSVETSDKRAMEDLKRNIPLYHIPPETQVDEYEMEPFPNRPRSS